MTIGIQLDRHDFLYDIHSLVKSFFPDDEVSIFTSDDEEKCSRLWELLLSIHVPEGEDRAGIRNALKRDLYETLSVYTGTDLPWGTLSGIRPTKIPMKLLREGKEEDEILSYLKETYLCSPKKARLATDVAEREKNLTDPLHLGPDSYSLYVHVPFCPSICLYCTFSSSPYEAWRSRIGAYLDTVIREMKVRREKILSSGGTLRPTTVYIGGGTPTALSPDELEKLLKAIDQYWDLSGILEYTVEAGRPDSITEEKLSVLKRHGVTRISVNPQTMNDRTLSYIGRRHTADDTKRAFALARKSGFRNINMDIILGLPGEEEQDVEHTLEEIRSLDPDSLTVHSLAIKRASRLRRKILEDREADRHADYGNFDGLVFENSGHLMDLASSYAYSMGMHPYYLYRQKNMRGNLENTGFSRPGSECYYNILIMEEMQSIEAFGAGATTKFVYPDGRIERNVSPKDVTTYLSRHS